MIDLSDLFTNAPTVTLMEPCGDTPYFVTRIRLLLNDAGMLRELTVTADLMTDRDTFEDVGCLALSVMDVSEPWRQPEVAGEWVDDGQSSVWDEADLPPSWCVTPGGEEIDLRGDGLFC